MIWSNSAGVAVVSLVLCEVPDANAGAGKDRDAKSASASTYDFIVKDIDCNDVKLSKYEDDVLLTVDVGAK